MVVNRKSTGRWMKVVVLAVGALCLGAEGALAEQRFRVRGRVLAERPGPVLPVCPAFAPPGDDCGLPADPVPGVSIVAANARGQRVASTRSDARGRYTLRLPSGRHTLTTDAGTEAREVRVRRKDVRGVDLIRRIYYVAPAE